MATAGCDLKMQHYNWKPIPYEITDFHRVCNKQGDCKTVSDKVVVPEKQVKEDYGF